MNLRFHIVGGASIANSSLKVVELAGQWAEENADTWRLKPRLKRSRVVLVRGSVTDTARV
jgi:hypothetical protein